MGRRLNLDSELRELLGSNNVYFQPPKSVQMQYPAFVYRRSDGLHTFADNNPYNFRVQYELTIITKDPDSDLIEKVANHFTRIRFSRHYTADNLNHDVYVIYY